MDSASSWSSLVQWLTSKLKVQYPLENINIQCSKCTRSYAFYDDVTFLIFFLFLTKRGSQPWCRILSVFNDRRRKTWADEDFRQTKGTGRMSLFRQTNRAIFVWPWNENARTKQKQMIILHFHLQPQFKNELFYIYFTSKQKQQTNGNTAIWLVYRTDTKARGFWLVKLSLR